MTEIFSQKLTRREFLQWAIISTLGIITAKLNLDADPEFISAFFETPKLPEIEPVKNQAVLGAHLVPTTERAQLNGQYNLKDIKMIQEALGVSPNIISIFCDMGRKPITYESIAALHDGGFAVEVSLEPRNYNDPQDNLKKYTAQNFLNGDFDQKIEDIGKIINQLDYPVLIRFGFEMNGSWFPWGRNNMPSEDFVLMWNYFFTKLKEISGENVISVFSPNHWPGLPSHLPKEDLVDYIAPDGYNKWDPASLLNGNLGYALNLNLTGAAIFNNVLFKLRQAYPNTPMGIAELGTGGNQTYRDKWIATLFRRALKQGVTRLSVFQYEKEIDWRIVGSYPETRAIVNGPFFVSSRLPPDAVIEQMLKVHK